MTETVSVEWGERVPELIERMRSFEADHDPDGWPAIQMREVSALLDEIERLNGVSCQLARELEDLIELADWAMQQANRDGAEYDRDGELQAARQAVGSYRGALPQQASDSPKPGVIVKSAKVRSVWRLADDTMF